jgi:C-terminal processing protease CtpA/Prc
MIRRRGLTCAHIPDVSAETLSFHPKSAALEHSRMAIFGECGPTKFHLPISEKWGIKVGDTEKGVLYIDRCSPGSCAWEQGIRKGDYIFQLEGETVTINCTPKKFEQKIINAKQCIQHKTVIEITLMRKKGSQKK